MSVPRNGASKLGYWIMGALLTITLGMAAWDRQATEGRIHSIENHVALASGVDAEIRELRKDLCRLEGKVDTLVEIQTGHRPYSIPCP